MNEPKILDYKKCKEWHFIFSGHTVDLVTNSCNAHIPLLTPTLQEITVHTTNNYPQSCNTYFKDSSEYWLLTKENYYEKLHLINLFHLYKNIPVNPMEDLHQEFRI